MRPFDVSLLRDDLAFVRRLARDLVGDDASADDVLQEAYRTILERPPRHAGNLRAYLALLVRRLSWKRRAGEERRARREEAVARPDRSEAGDELVAKVEIHRLTVEALMRLREPYRRTLLLRYFEDLPVAEVARRLGVPRETARTRLKRALALLREELDRLHPRGRRDWLSALAPLAGARREPRALPLASSLAVLGLVAAGIWIAAPRPTLRPARAAGGDAPRGPAPPELVDAAGGGSRSPAAGAPARTAAADAARAGGDLLRGLVRDAAGPLAGALVRANAARLDGSAPLGEVLTDAEGRFALALDWRDAPPAERAASSLTLSVEARAHLPHAELVSDWRPLLGVERVIELEPGRSLRARVLDPAGRPASWVLAALSSTDEAGATVRTFDGCDGAGELRMPLLPGLRPHVLEVWSSSVGFVRLRVADPGAGDPDLGVLRLETLGRIAGRIVHPDGSPAPASALFFDRVEAEPLAAPDASPPQTSPEGVPGLASGFTYADEEGRFELAGLVPGSYRLQPGRQRPASAAESLLDVRATGETDVRVETGASRLSVEVVDEAGRCVRGALVRLARLDASGAPLPGARSTRTRSDGGRAFLEVPAGESVAVFAEAPGFVGEELLVPVPRTTYELVRTLVLRPARGDASLSLDVHGPSGEPVGAVAVDLRTERGDLAIASLAGLVPDASGRLHGLPAGRFRVRISPRGEAAARYLPGETEAALELRPEEAAAAPLLLHPAGLLRLEIVRRGSSASDGEPVGLAGTGLADLACMPSELSGVRLEVRAVDGGGAGEAEGAPEVVLEGSELERAAREGLPLAPGPHRLRVRSSRFLDLDREVRVVAGETERLWLTLEERD